MDCLQSKPHFSGGRFVSQFDDFIVGDQPGSVPVLGLDDMGSGELADGWKDETSRRLPETRQLPKRIPS
ncbi:hypothetical protein RISK_003692 [Rhodopirellula islandica]|uniref:Uncharacterized protein n=1 Tax=Rhodopirellula islandica TaxID=595434 RepID=A0A0J1BC67_RHOIS|nr:hypothetical protein [Rhodopirellula islandica]KLU04106.1 hypothetical protein RISK_003692 [Rhodopirellula islandica]